MIKAGVGKRAVAASTLIYTYSVPVSRNLCKPHALPATSCATRNFMRYPQLLQAQAMSLCTLMRHATCDKRHPSTPSACKQLVQVVRCGMRGCTEVGWLDRGFGGLS